MGSDRKSSWVDSDTLAKAICAIPSPSEYASRTLALDQSQPPTPDGTGRPTNFQTIAPGLYRSSFPQMNHFDTLCDLSLKTIITFVPQPLELPYSNFITSNGIIHYHIPILANKNADICTDTEVVHQVLELMLDPNNYPMLVHCNKGKHRTGCMTACFRKVCGWTNGAAIDEYIRYSTPKERVLDKAFIERFDPSPLKSIALDRGYVGGVYKQPLSGDTQISERSMTTVYTNNSVATYSNSDGEIQHEYQEQVRKVNNQTMESQWLWDYR